MSKSINWNRPRDKIRGRQIETINGADPTIGMMPRTPRAQPQSKAELRKMADDAVRAMTPRRIEPPAPPPAPIKPRDDEPPPW